MLGRLDYVTVVNAAHSQLAQCVCVVSAVYGRLDHVDVLQ